MKSSKEDDQTSSGPEIPSSFRARDMRRKEATEAVPPNGRPFILNIFTQLCSVDHTAIHATSHTKLTVCFSEVVRPANKPTAASMYLHTYFDHRSCLIDGVHL